MRTPSFCREIGLWAGLLRVGTVRVDTFTPEPPHIHGFFFEIEKWAIRDRQSMGDERAIIDYVLPWNVRHRWPDLPKDEDGLISIIARCCVEDAISRAISHFSCEPSPKTAEVRRVTLDLLADSQPFQIGRSLIHFDGEDDFELRTQCATDILVALERIHRVAKHPGPRNQYDLYAMGMLSEFYQWGEYAPAFESLTSSPMCVALGDESILITEVGRSHLRERLKTVQRRTLSCLLTRPNTTAIEFDVFVCHASEDKAGIANPLSHAMEAQGIRVWIDAGQIQWGDSITQKINDGLSKSRFVVLVLSEPFLNKKWPEKEMNAVMAREIRSGVTCALPLIVGGRETRERVLAAYPLLGDKQYEIWNAGDAERIVSRIRERLAER